MKTTGASASILRTELLPADAPLQHARTAAARRRAKASTSPSSTVPSGSGAAAAAISGKRSVISSSPRDQRYARPPRRTSCARMPSHFHSASQSARSPSASTARPRAARRGRTDRAATCPSPRRPARAALAKAAADGAQSPISACATIAGGRPARSRERAHDQRLRDADAQLAGEQLVEQEALPLAGSPSHAASTARACCASGGGRAGAAGAPRSSCASGGRPPAPLGRPRRSSSSATRLGEVARRAVALLEQPVRARRALARPVARSAAPAMQPLAAAGR